MGAGGGLWESLDTITAARMNQKTTYMGSAAPGSTYGGQFWHDTDDDRLYIRNTADDAWINLYTSSWTTFAVDLEAENANGWTIRNVPGTATTPSLIPDKTDINTGIGQAAADQLSLIAGGDEIVRLVENGASGNTTFISGEILTASGTDDRTVDIYANLNMASGAGGSDVFNLIKGNISETNFAGWDIVNLMDLQIDGTGVFTVNSDGDVTAGIWQGTAIADGYIASAATWNAKQAALNFGIADTNTMVVDDADAADNDYAKFTASGLEGRSYAEVVSDLGIAAAYAPITHASTHEDDGADEISIAGLLGAIGTAAQGSITSLGTLTTLTIDNITINGSTMSSSGDLLMQQNTQAANWDSEVHIFGDGVSQSGNYYSGVHIYGGGSQSRRLSLYQVYGGNATVESSYGALVLEGGSNNNTVIIDADYLDLSGASLKGAATIVEKIAPDEHSIGEGAKVLEDQTAAVSLVFGDIVNYNNNTGKWDKTDADQEGFTKGLCGFWTETTAADGTGTVMLEGTAEDASWSWDVSARSQPLYIATTSGDITETAPSAAGDYVRIVGETIDATHIRFNPAPGWIGL
jgi:hypothetical protein